MKLGGFSYESKKTHKTTISLYYCLQVIFYMSVGKLLTILPVIYLSFTII